jgi:hypothetical protein
MQLRGPWRLILVAILASLTMLPLPQASAQTTGLDTQTRAQLAAIPLTSGELPQGYRLVTEGFTPDGQAAFTNIDQASLAGYVGLYSSVYENPEAPGGIMSYVSVWTDAAAAEAGFAIVEDETVTSPGVALIDAELDAGTGSAELTAGTVEENGTALNVTDATFVVERFIVGVTVRTADDSPIDASGITAMVDALEGRANAVLSGQAPSGADLGLPGTVIDVRPLGVEQQAGFLSASESEALYGLSGSSLGGIQTSWVSYVATGDQGAAPYVAVAVSTFENADNAARVVEQSADLVPLTVELQPVEGYSVEGVEAVRGYQYASPGAAVPDSFRAVAQIGAQLVVIDVQGAASVEQAQTAATDLLAAQVRCGNGDCTLPQVNLG